MLTACKIISSFLVCLERPFLHEACRWTDLNLWVILSDFELFHGSMLLVTVLLDYVSTSINRKRLWRIVSHDPIYTKKIDDLNVHFVPVTRYHYLVSNLRLTNTYLPCEQDFTNCNQFCTMWKNNNMWTYFHNEFFPIYQSNSVIWVSKRFS